MTELAARLDATKPPSKTEMAARSDFISIARKRLLSHYQLLMEEAGEPEPLQYATLSFLRGIAIEAAKSNVMSNKDQHTLSLYDAIIASKRSLEQATGTGMLTLLTNYVRSPCRSSV